MRRVLGIWGIAQATLLAAVLIVAAWAGIGAETHPLADGRWWLDRFLHWDGYHFVRIATEGYFTPSRRCCDQAYLPAYPLAMRLLAPLLGGSAALAGVVVSLLAGVAAAAALWRLAGQRRLAVVALAVAPAAVFLVTVYSEALWLAAALWAWWWARQDRWWLAGLAASVAAATRITGLFLLLGLVVGYAVTHRRRWRLDAFALAFPLVPLLGYAAWLHAETGSWSAWRQAQTVGWDRVTVLPWTAVGRQLAAIGTAGSPGLSFTRTLDLVAVLGGVGLCVVAVRRKAWAELGYLAPSIAVLLTTSNMDSSARYALAWFPAYIWLSELAERRPRLAAILLGCSGLLAAVVLVLWATRRWAG